ncbi:hypothetical protein [Neolewinella antarctica]|uniref:Uncharacterized protein n=1 Tax=Neolewinella antarctica TaxID=442734 RepID=A0ABX0XE91_9BACT|nr:hypothetical protein [Neolewinella antarctica]NJC27410.1 hypothetical protein [Neolewinella antarctica]
MHPTYQVRPLGSESIAEVPTDWTPADYRAILDATEYGDTSALSDEELAEMACMSLADLDKPESAELLLKHVFTDEELNTGQIENASHEMASEKLWEEYPEPDKHRGFFRAASLLYRAYNGGFPRVDGRIVTISVTPEKKAGAEHLTELTPAFVLRLLAGGMDDHALLHRLYGDELASESFPSAPNITWDVTTKPGENGATEITVFSSDYWLDAFNPANDYVVTAYPDEIPEED